MSKQPTRVIMECEHDAYYHAPVPNAGDDIWCIKCGGLSTVGPVVTQVQWTYHPECNWRSRRRKGMFTGECAEDGCKEPSHESHNWYQLRTVMERHYLRTHISNPLPPFVLVDLLPPGSPAPF